MPPHHHDLPDPLDGQNYSHTSGSPMASMPDPVPQKADQTRESLVSKMTAAGINIVIMVVIIVVIML